MSRVERKWDQCSLSEAFASVFARQGLFWERLNQTFQLRSLIMFYTKKKRLFVKAIKNCKLQIILELPLGINFFFFRV